MLFGVSNLCLVCKMQGPASGLLFRSLSAYDLSSLLVRSLLLLLHRFRVCTSGLAQTIDFLHVFASFRKIVVFPLATNYLPLTLPSFWGVALVVRQSGTALEAFRAAFARSPNRWVRNPHDPASL